MVLVGVVVEEVAVLVDDAVVVLAVLEVTVDVVSDVVVAVSLEVVVVIVVVDVRVSDAVVLEAVLLVRVADVDVSEVDVSVPVVDVVVHPGNETYVSTPYTGPTVSAAALYSWHSSPPASYENIKHSGAAAMQTMPQDSTDGM